ncbi:MAG: LuxR C-terminal-related transcriptional regulator [Actinomycetota bacterium]
MLVNSPSGGSIVGRADAVRGLTELVAGSRLVTLIGPGGVGKSTLAAEVIDEVEPEFGQIVVVPLADADDDSEVLRVAAAALAEEAELSLDGFVASVSAMPTLLVLDNCEHVVDAAATLVGAVIRGADEVRVLATSRRPLDLSGEAIWPVWPLAVPAEDTTVDLALGTASVQLFVERARNVAPTFDLDEDNLGAVVDICRLADGVPLVLELAAALVRTQPLAAIRTVMTESGVETASRDVLDHHRSVAASLDWSRRFLPGTDLDLFDRLAVFVGGFRADAVEAVAPDSDLGALRRLVDHSLVQFDPRSGRYRILEPVRRDSLARLAADELAAAQAAHVTYCVRVVDQIHRARHAPDPENEFPRFWAEAANIRAALRRLRGDDDIEGYFSLVGPIAPWIVHYVPSERPSEWEALLDRPGVEIPSAWRANISLALAFHASHRARHQDALRYAEAAQLHVPDDDIHVALAELASGNAHVELGATDAARSSYRRTIELATDTGETYPGMLGRIALARLDPDDPETTAYLEDALEMARDGFAAMHSMIAAELAGRSHRQQRHLDAIRLADEAIEQARRTTAGEILASALTTRAELAIADGERTMAGELLDEAGAVGRIIGHQPLLARIDDAWQALDAGASSLHDGSVSANGGLIEPLSERELGVLRLLRGDLTQREIGDELYIAASTVKSHIKSIYRKLGVGKRSHAITRAGELGLFD